MPTTILTEEPPTAQAPARLPLERRRAAFHIIESQYRHKARLLALTTEADIRRTQQAALAAELARLRAQLWPESIPQVVAP